MGNELKTNQNQDSIDQDEVFKTLSHQIRRNILSILGKHGKLTFTEIKNKISQLDSPSLSYHLKNLKFLVNQKDSDYFLTEIGEAALVLIDKMEENTRYKQSKKKFLVANILTVICWISIQIIVPTILKQNNVDQQTIIIIIILLNIVPQINYLMIFNLWGRSYHKKKASS